MKRIKHTIERVRAALKSLGKNLSLPTRRPVPAYLPVRVERGRRYRR